MGLPGEALTELWGGGGHTTKEAFTLFPTNWVPLRSRTLKRPSSDNQSVCAEIFIGKNQHVKLDLENCAAREAQASHYAI